MKNYTKMQRNKIYKQAYEWLYKERHEEMDKMTFICHAINFALRKKNSCTPIPICFKEFYLIAPVRWETGSWDNFLPMRGKRSDNSPLKLTALALMIAMTS